MKNYKSEFRKLYENTKLSMREIDDEINFVTEILTGKKSDYFLLGNDLSEQNKQQIKTVLTEHIKTGKPLQYIVGKAFFANSEYYVDENTLIPRPETEFLVQECIKNCRIKNPEILDIGTGSGCIAVELAKNIKDAKITAVDLCQQCVDVAVKNADKYGVLPQIKFVCSDLFDNISGQFDIIVSNPPYISFSDKNEVQKDVFDYEPHQALFADDDGFFFYKKITENSSIYLKQNGILAFEIGWKQAEKVRQIMENIGFVNIMLTKDLDGIERVITAVKIN